MFTNVIAERYTTLEVLTASPALAMNVREEYPDLDVRIGFDIDNQPWFVLKDYCYSIGLAITADILDILPKENLALVDMAQEKIEVAYMFAKNMTYVYFINQEGADILINAANQQANEEIKVGLLGECTNTVAGNYNTEVISTSNIRLWSKPNFKEEEDLMSSSDYQQVVHSSGNNEIEIKVGQPDAQGFIPILIKPPET